MNKENTLKLVQCFLVGAGIGIIVSCLTGCGQGATGNPGKDGESIVGPKGAQGAGCSVGTIPPGDQLTNGGSLVTCGNTVTMISNGANGAPALSMHVVKLCPGTTVYPSKFVEVAACFGDTLYGVYSANGGFLTELPAGYYGSQGINSSCNFTVGPNCAISH